jgi:hypothetical protein
MAPAGRYDPPIRSRAPTGSRRRWFPEAGRQDHPGPERREHTQRGERHREYGDVVGGLQFSTVFTLVMIRVLRLATIRFAERIDWNTIPPAVALELEERE